MENVLIFIKIITDWVEELQENYIKLDGSIGCIGRMYWRSEKCLKRDCEG